MASKRRKVALAKRPRAVVDPRPVPTPQPRAGRPRTVAGMIMGFVGSLIESRTPKLEPGETELMPALRICPKCGWQAGEECRWDIRCPRCDTYMPYAGSKIVGADGQERTPRDPMSGGLFDPPKDPEPED